MPPRKNGVRRAGALQPNAELWLAGDKACGFIMFKPADELEELWNAHGDPAQFYWERGMRLPKPIEDIKDVE